MSAALDRTPKPCACCLNPDICELLGRWCDVPESTRKLARLAAYAQATDKRSDAEKIADGVRFIMDTRLGGE